MLRAVGASLLLHAVAIMVLPHLPFGDVAAPVQSPPIEARLRLPPEERTTEDALLKNTLPPAEKASQAHPPAPKAAQRAARAKQRPPVREADARRRESDNTYYPPEALERGLEGDVIVLIEVGVDGRVRSATVASSSGHPSLDEAALRAVRAGGATFPDAAGRTLLLPVRFRLD